MYFTYLLFIYFALLFYPLLTRSVHLNLPHFIRSALFFSLSPYRCVAAGVGLREIEGHLDKRSLKVTRRPGNAKAWRSENASQVRVLYLHGYESVCVCGRD